MKSIRRGRKAAADVLDCRKSCFAAFSRKLRCVLRLCCPLIADNSTLTPRKVFSATHMSRQKTYHTAFASADAKLCEAFFDKLASAAVEKLRRMSYFSFENSMLSARRSAAVSAVFRVRLRYGAFGALPVQIYYLGIVHILTSCSVIRPLSPI